MKLEKITYYVSSSNSNMVFNIDIDVENNTQFTIEMVKVSCCFADQDIQADNSFEAKTELFIEPNDSGLVNIEALLITAIESDKDKLKTTLNILAYRREYYDLGVSSALNAVNCLKDINTETEVGNGIHLLDLKYYQDDYYEENDSVQIGVDGVFYNATDVIIEDLVFGMHVIAENGEIITSSHVSEIIYSNIRKTVSIRCLGLKNGRIKGSKLQLYLSIYLPIIKKIITGIAIKE